MKVSANIDDKEFRAALRRVSRKTGRPLQKVVRQSANRVAVNLARGTAPFGDSESDYERGKKKARSDVSRVWKSVPEVMSGLEEEQRSQLAFILNNRGPAAIAKFLRSLGIDLNYRKGATRKLHKQYRRRGRVPRNQKPVYMVPHKVKDKIMGQVEARVGMAKAAWAHCARLIGASGVRMLPRWIHSRKGVPAARLASVRASQGRHGLNFEMRNQLPYASAVTSHHATVKAIARERDYLANEAVGRVRKAWRR